MGFRTLEISHAAEIHIKEGQLEITTDDGIAVVPIEDLNQIMVHGANIRLSTMDLSILSQNPIFDTCETAKQPHPLYLWALWLFLSSLRYVLNLFLFDFI